MDWYRALSLAAYRSLEMTSTEGPSLPWGLAMTYKMPYSFASFPNRFTSSVRRGRTTAGAGSRVSFLALVLPTIFRSDWDRASSRAATFFIPDAASLTAASPACRVSLTIKSATSPLTSIQIHLLPLPPSSPPWSIVRRGPASAVQAVGDGRRAPPAQGMPPVPYLPWTFHSPAG